MASYRAMKDLANDPAAVKAVAKSLLSLGQAAEGQRPIVEWTDWEIDFLEGLEGRGRDGEALSMRQREKLDELRRAAERLKAIDGFSLRALIEGAFIERLDLDDEEDLAFIEGLMADQIAARAGGFVFTLSGRQAQRLKRCCRVLGVIEPHQAAA